MRHGGENVKDKVDGYGDKIRICDRRCGVGPWQGNLRGVSGRLFKAAEFAVQTKNSSYINVDPGTMSPYQHGEVFVTDDGAETDLDLGHYERFVDENLTGNSSVSSGKIYWSVLKPGAPATHLPTVQIIPSSPTDQKPGIRHGR